MGKSTKQHEPKKAPKAVPPKKRSKGKPAEVVVLAAPPEPKPAEPPPSAPTVSSAERDPRLPPVGAVMKRTFKGNEYAVTVLEAGFEFQGKPFKSLSKIAREITGTSWNGFGFFNLLAKPEKPSKEERQ